MKKKFMYAAWMIASAAVVFSSCSKENVVSDENQGLEQGVEDNSQVLTLSIASSGDGLTTRAGRPLFSNAPGQSIENVVLYFVNSNGKIVLRKKVDWTTAIPYNDNRGHGKELEISLKGDQKLKDDGTYTIYALGHSTVSDYTFIPTLPSKDDAEYDASASQEWSEFKAALTEVKDGEEVFAGSTKVEVIDKSFNLGLNGRKNAITLHRQVAGMTGYFYNIPVSVNGKATKYLRLVSVNKNTVVKFGQFNSDFTTTGSKIQYVVNGDVPASKDACYAGSQVANAHTIYTIDLADWFIPQNGRPNDFASCDLNNDGFLGYEDVKKFVDDNPGVHYNAIWKNPYFNEGARFVRGSVFSGKFVIPFEKGETNTLQLQLLDADKNVTKYWNINASHINTNGNAEEGSWVKFDTDKSIYNIYRNHMYNVGMKSVDNPTDPTDPTDPVEPTDPTDPDPEVPENLAKGQDLIIQVNDNWEIIHDMELD